MTNARASDSPDPETPGPPVWVELPDGQSVTAQFIGRLQRLGPGGGWWCDLLLPMWSEVQLPDAITVEPDSAVFRVPARLVTPIEGTDYSGVPTRRERLPQRRGPHPSAAALPGRWSVQHLPTPAGSAGRRVIHHEGCWIPTGEADLTLDQALDELARPGSEACTACEARQLPRS